MKQSETNVLTNQQTIDYLRHLRMPGMIAAYEEQRNNPAFADLSFEQRFAIIVKEEYDRRYSSRTVRLLRDSGISNWENANIENIMYNSERNLDKGLVNQLASFDWVNSDKHPSVVVTGASGCGKTYFCKAIAQRACEKHVSVAYYRLFDLIQTLKRDRIPVRRRITRANLFILDDFGLTQMDADIRSELLSILDERMGHMACIIAAQLPIEQWYAYINEGYVADAIMDRVTNLSYKIELKGPSLRENYELK